MAVEASVVEAVLEAVAEVQAAVEALEGVGVGTGGLKDLLEVGLVTVTSGLTSTTGEKLALVPASCDWSTPLCAHGEFVGEIEGGETAMPLFCCSNCSMLFCCVYK